MVRLVFLSHHGLKALDREAPFASFELFSKGMAADSAVLDDGSISSWQPQLQQHCDVLLLVAYHAYDDLVRIVGRMLTDFEDGSAGMDVLLIQEGRAYRNADGEGVEHFGYVDGRSQPLMVSSDIDRESAEAGSAHHNAAAPLGQFVLPDPLDNDGCGSFFVFRKLEQNVAGFKQAERQLATTLSLAGADTERAGAQIVGRFEDGTPLVEHPAPDGVPVANDFNYGNDGGGGRCPFHAHIRKTHPRGASPGGLEFDNAVQMARRGITYGLRMQDPDSKVFIDQPNDGVGLLFMSYQTSIESQFHFMQTAWANNENFPSNGVGIDPVIGQGGTLEQAWFPDYGNASGAKPHRIAGFVTLKGGEYFFAPSVPGLRGL